MNKQELLKGLSKEQIAKVKNCHNQEELLKIAKQEGIELSDEQLEAVNGGWCTSTPDFECPVCGSKKVKSKYCESNMATWWSNTCEGCGHHWTVNK